MCGISHGRTDPRGIGGHDTSLMQIKRGWPVHLPVPERAAKMHGMSRRRWTSLVAAFATLALLLCQAVGLVHGRTIERTATEANGAACHTIPDEQGHTGKAVHIPCDEAQSVAETFKLPAVTPALLCLAATLVLTPAHAHSPALATHVAHAGAAPPLHLLYSRLRN